MGEKEAGKILSQIVTRTNSIKEERDHKSELYPQIIEVFSEIVSTHGHHDIHSFGGMSTPEVAIESEEYGNHYVKIVEVKAPVTPSPFIKPSLGQNFPIVLKGYAIVSGGARLFSIDSFSLGSEMKTKIAGENSTAEENEQILTEVLPAIIEKLEEASAVKNDRLKALAKELREGNKVRPVYAQGIIN